MSEPAKIDFRPFFEELKGKPALTPKVMGWVANHLEVPLSQITPEDAPSMFAMTLLDHAKNHRTDFIAEYMAWTRPTKAQMEQQAGGMSDDGRATPILDGLEREIAAAKEVQDANSTD